MSRKLAAVVVGVALSAMGVAAGTAQASGAVRAISADPSTGTYYPVTPTRLLDTRSQGPALGPQASRTVQVTGRAGVPATGVSAVVINLTATGASASTFLTAYPSGKTRPAQGSSINVKPGVSIANNVTVQPGNDGKIAIYNNLGTTQVIVDIVGWFTTDDAYHASTGQQGAGYFYEDAPWRLYDNRTDADGRLQAGWATRLRISFGDSAEAANFAASVRAVVINVTATWANRSGNLKAWDAASAVPTASTLNYVPGRAVANLAVVPVSPADPGVIQIGVANEGTSSVAPIVDVFGYYAASSGGLVFVPKQQTRLFDTRLGGSSTNVLSGAFNAGQTRTVHTDTRVAGDPTYVLISNLTATNPTKTTHLDVWSSGARPAPSNLNVVAGETRANAAYVTLANDNSFNVYNDAGSTDAILDVVGTLDAPMVTGLARSSALAPTGHAAPSAPQRLSSP